MPNGDLHSYAVDASENLERLATGLGQAGAPPETVEAVTKMADVTRQIIKSLGAGQEQTADDAPPARPTMDSATNELHQATVAAARPTR